MKVGERNRTYLGFPGVPNAVVHAALEEMHLRQNSLIDQTLQFRKERIGQCQRRLVLLRWELSVSYRFYQFRGGRKTIEDGTGTRKRKHAQPNKPCLEIMFQEDPFLPLRFGDVVPGPLHLRGQRLWPGNGGEGEQAADYNGQSAETRQDGSMRTGTRLIELRGSWPQIYST